MVFVDPSKCKGCGQCVNDCVTGNIRLQDGKAVCYGPCILCGHCVAICPRGAVSIPSYEMTDVEPYDADRYGLDLNNLIYTIKFRRSIRRYMDRPVEREKLERVVQAGRYTATGANRQGCRFVVVQDSLSTLKDMVWRGVETAKAEPSVLPAEMLPSLQNFVAMRAQGTDYLFRNAPVVIYVAAESEVDAALAAQNMELAAVSEGLGVLYNGYLVYASSMNPYVCEWLDVQEKRIAVSMLIGYPQISYLRTAPRRAADVLWR